MPEITLAQGTIRYDEAGPPDGPAVVFVHGFLGNGGLWRATADDLAARGCRTFTPDWPLGAHRIPVSPSADLTPRGVARMVAGFLEALELDDVTLVGNDSGGAVTQFVLDTDASRVGRVVLTNCDALDRFPPKPFDLLLKAARRPRLMRVLMEPTRLAAVRHSPLAFGPLAAQPLDPVQSREWVIPYVTIPGVRRDAGRFCSGIDPHELADVATRLRHFEGPVLMCWGLKDRFFDIALARRLQPCFADARLVEIADASTFVMLDQPQRLAQEIGAFVGAVSPAPRPVAS